MEIYSPVYFNSFRCIAADCPDSCCKDWEVDVDDAAAERYRALSGELGERLRSVMRDTGDGISMTLEQGRCPMWRQDGLCRIQAELGHEALCNTCREFPRLRHDYGDFVELGLELSCPEAARIILNAREHGMLVTALPGGEAPDYDPEIMRILRSSREEMLTFLKTTPFSLRETLAVILLYAHGVQGAIDGGEFPIFTPTALLREAKGYGATGDIKKIFAFFRNLEILTPRWDALLQHPAHNGNWPKQIALLAIYMVQRYWLQAISDYDLVCRVKLVVAACLLVNALGGDVQETAQLFSKEIENNADNVEMILDGAYSNAAFTDMNLLGLLLA